MRNRILHYLRSVGSPQTSGRILESVLKIRSPNAASADRVLQAIIGDDPHFQFAEGAWRPRAPRPEDLAKNRLPAMTLFIQRPDVKANPMCMRGAIYKRDTSELLEFDLTRSLQGLDVKALGRWHAEAAECLLVVWSRDMLRPWDLLLKSCRLERRQDCVLCLRNLAARVLSRGIREIHPESLAASLGLPAPDSERPGKMAQFLGSCLDPLVEMVPEGQRSPAANLVSWVEKDESSVDFSRLSFGQDFLRQLPVGPGVYVMRNRATDIIYVGKAANIKRRVASYFTSRALKDPRTAKMHEQIHSLEAIPTASELDALLLETRMIRDFRPPVNLQLEIHEQQAGYGKGRNLILLAKQSDPEMVQACFLRDGVFVAQQSVRLGRPAPKNLRARVRSIYFPARGRSRKRRESWEMEIVSRWLARHRRQVNFVDIDDAGNYESATRLLNCYLLDPDRLSKRVLYR